MTKQINVTTFNGAEKDVVIHHGADNFTIGQEGNLRIWADNKQVAEHKVWSYVSKGEIK